MNVTDKTNPQYLQQSVERIQMLVREQRFTYGQPAHWSDGVVDVSVDRVWDEEHKSVEHLVTVYTGLPFGPALQDVSCIVRRADTDIVVAEPRLDRRGQIWLENLEPGQYHLGFQIKTGVLVQPVGNGSPIVWEVQLALAAASDRDVPWVESSDGKSRHRLESVNGNWQLTFEVEPAFGGDSFLRFEFETDSGSLRGFVGLYEVESGKRRGSILLALLAPKMDWSNVRRYKLAAYRQVWSDLKPEDRADLERSRDASQEDRCADVLDKALRQLLKAPPA